MAELTYVERFTKLGIFKEAKALRSDLAKEWYEMLNKAVTSAKKGSSVTDILLNLSNNARQTEHKVYMQHNGPAGKIRVWDEYWGYADVDRNDSIAAMLQSLGADSESIQALQLKRADKVTPVVAITFSKGDGQNPFSLLPLVYADQIAQVLKADNVSSSIIKTVRAYMQQFDSNVGLQALYIPATPALKVDGKMSPVIRQLIGQIKSLSDQATARCSQFGYPVTDSDPAANMGGLILYGIGRGQNGSKTVLPVVTLPYVVAESTFDLRSLTKPSALCGQSSKSYYAALEQSLSQNQDFVNEKIFTNARQWFSGAYAVDHKDIGSGTFKASVGLEKSIVLIVGNKKVTLDRIKGDSKFVKYEGLVSVGDYKYRIIVSNLDSSHSRNIAIQREPSAANVAGTNCDFNDFKKNAKGLSKVDVWVTAKIKEDLKKLQLEKEEKEELAAANVAMRAPVSEEDAYDDAEEFVPEEEEPKLGEPLDASNYPLRVFGKDIKLEFVGSTSDCHQYRAHEEFRFFKYLDFAFEIQVDARADKCINLCVVTDNCYAYKDKVGEVVGVETLESVDDFHRTDGAKSFAEERVETIIQREADRINNSGLTKGYFPECIQINGETCLPDEEWGSVTYYNKEKSSSEHGYTKRETRFNYEADDSTFVCIVFSYFDGITKCHDLEIRRVAKSKEPNYPYDETMYLEGLGLWQSLGLQSPHIVVPNDIPDGTDEETVISEWFNAVVMAELRRTSNNGVYLPSADKPYPEVLNTKYGKVELQLANDDKATKKKKHSIGILHVDLGATIGGSGVLEYRVDVYQGFDETFKAVSVNLGLERVGIGVAGDDPSNWLELRGEDAGDNYDRSHLQNQKGNMRSRKLCVVGQSEGVIEDWYNEAVAKDLEAIKKASGVRVDLNKPFPESITVNGQVYALSTLETRVRKERDVEGHDRDGALVCWKWSTDVTVGENTYKCIVATDEWQSADLSNLTPRYSVDFDIYKKEPYQRDILISDYFKSEYEHTNLEIEDFRSSLAWFEDMINQDAEARSKGTETLKLLLHTLEYGGKEWEVKKDLNVVGFRKNDIQINASKVNPKLHALVDIHLRYPIFVGPDGDNIKIAMRFEYFEDRGSIGSEDCEVQCQYDEGAALEESLTSVIYRALDSKLSPRLAEIEKAEAEERAEQERRLSLSEPKELAVLGTKYKADKIDWKHGGPSIQFFGVGTFRQASWGYGVEVEYKDPTVETGPVKLYVGVLRRTDQHSDSLDMVDSVCYEFENYDVIKGNPGSVSKKVEELILEDLSKLEDEGGKFDPNNVAIWDTLVKVARTESNKKYVTYYYDYANDGRCTFSFTLPITKDGVPKSVVAKFYANGVLIDSTSGKFAEHFDPEVWVRKVFIKVYRDDFIRKASVN